jgi:Nif-specific regulatory protein
MNKGSKGTLFLRRRGSGRTYRLADYLLIGRSSNPECTLALSHDSVSRRHAEIIRRPEGVIVNDLGSKNGTFLNGKPIAAPTAISLGDILTIGRVEFVVQSEEFAQVSDQMFETEQFLSDSPLGSPIEDITRASISAETLSIVRQREEKPAREEAGPRLQKRIKLIAELTTTLRLETGHAHFESSLTSKILDMFPQAKRCMIIIKGSHGDLSLRAAAFCDSDASNHVKISKTIIHHVLEQSQSILSIDTQEEVDFVEAESVFETGILSFICAPFLGKEGSFGVIYLDVLADVECFSDEDLVFLTVIANQVALAMENTQLVERLGLDRDRLLEENRRLREAEAAGFHFDSIIFNSQKMKAVLKHTQKVAQTDSSVLILGDRGTGKELIANAIHYNSLRKDQPFEIVNCAAISHDLMESELFGHEKGAFTGADKTKPGLFELANHGTLFLDEIGDLPLPAQAKFLRAVENGQIRRLGGTKDMEVDVRIIAATNRDLKKEAAENRFRADLYDRLNVAVIRLPSLSERKEDILILADHFIKKLRKKMNKDVVGLSDDALSILYQYDWPGNVRELRNVIEKSMIDVQGDIILPSHLPTDITKICIEFDKYKREGKLTEAENALKKEMINDALSRFNGNKTKAAEALGISRAGLRKMMQSLGFKDLIRSD